jgi:RNAse (barnase) inhibitor barstar
MKNQNDKVSAAIVLKAIEDEAKPLLKKLGKVVITDNKDFENASVITKQLKGLMKLADDKEKSLTDPLIQVVKDIRLLFKPFKDEVKLMEEGVKQNMLAFVAKQKQLEAKVESDLASGKIKKVSTAVAKQAALQVSSSSSQVRKVWQAVEVDASKTPREYLIPDEAAIKAALKDGKKVNGWKWEQVESIAI